MRISVPEVPHKDDAMREILQLLIGSFDNLGDTGSSFGRRVKILESMVSVRMCVFMIDLGL